MQADEYDLLIDDPTDYLLHVWLPRTVAGMKGFAKLVSPLDMVEIVAAPDLSDALGGPRGAGKPREAEGRRRGMPRPGAGNVFPLLGRLVAEGFPGTIGAMSKAPFDVIGDTLRGTRGVIIDMFRQPDRLLEACDRLVEPHA